MKNFTKSIFFLGLCLFLWNNAIASTISKQVPQVCYQIQEQLESKLPAKLTLYYPIKKHQLCILELHASGEVFEKNDQDFRKWNKVIQKTLHKHGWYNTKRPLTFAANGPYSTIFAYKHKKNKTYAVVNFDLTGNTTHCPQNEPMDLYSNCGLKPAERNYVLTVTLRK